MFVSIVPPALPQGLASSRNTILHLLLTLTSFVSTQQEESFVIIIQKTFRGFIVRKALEAQGSAVTNIAAIYRGYRARTAFNVAREAALDIQKSFRGFIARKAMLKKREATAAAEKKAAAIMTHAATTIAALFRGFRIRKDLADTHMSKTVTRIQAASRGFIARKALKKQRDAYMTHAATTIAALFRGFRVRKDLKEEAREAKYERTTDADEVISAEEDEASSAATCAAVTETVDPTTAEEDCSDGQVTKKMVVTCLPAAASFPLLKDKSHWVDDGSSVSCSSCRNHFTFFNRRHHCRNCGYLFCNACSTHRAPVRSRGWMSATRVCDGCFEHGIDTVPDKRTKSAIAIQAVFRGYYDRRTLMVEKKEQSTRRTTAATPPAASLAIVAMNPLSTKEYITELPEVVIIAQSLPKEPLPESPLRPIVVNPPKACPRDQVGQNTSPFTLELQEQWKHMKAKGSISLASADHRNLMKFLSLGWDEPLASEVEFREQLKVLKPVALRDIGEASIGDEPEFIALSRFIGHN